MNHQRTRFALVALTLLVATALAGPASSKPLHDGGSFIIPNPGDHVGLQVSCPGIKDESLGHTIKTASTVDAETSPPLLDQEPSDTATDLATRYCTEPSGGQSPPDESCVQGTCESPQPPTPPRPRPPAPDVPTQFGTAFEAVAENTTTAPTTPNHDWDNDGVPDLLDAVNLPSESQETTASQDLLSLPDGLPDGGFTLLVEPSHQEAYLIMGDVSPRNQEAISSSEALDRLARSHSSHVRQAISLALADLTGLFFGVPVPADDHVESLDEPDPENVHRTRVDSDTSDQEAAPSGALGRIADDHGNRIRQAMAMVLHDGMRIHFRSALPEVPQDIALDDWTGGSKAADGSWLLVRTDPDRRLQLTLAGDLVHVAVRAASQFSPEEQVEYRWEFLNLHSGDNLCYDPTTATNLTSCQGTRWPGWIRAYSGQASYALESTWLALEQDKIPLSSPAPPLLPGQVTSQPTSQQSSQTSPLPSPVEALDIFDEDSPWQALGSNSKALDAGVGIDYNPLPLDAGETPLVAQVPVNGTAASTLVDGDVRRFHFQGAVFQMPATPRDLVHVKLGITPVDGNHSARDFRIDGAALDALLGPEAAGALQARIDEGHREGFTFEVVDDDGDGHNDLHVHVPHFSTTWIEVYRDDSHVSFRDIEMTSATTGWLAGADRAVYRYETGHLTEVGIPVSGSTAEMLSRDLHVLSDTNFWVVGGRWVDGTTEDPPFIAHYVSGTWNVHTFSDIHGDPLTKIWMKNDGSLGYAGGRDGLWVKYTPSTEWNIVPIPTACTITDIAFDSTGKGFVSVWGGVGAWTGEPGTQCPDRSNTDIDNAILYYDGSSFSSASDSDTQLVVDVEEENRKWAVAAQPGTGTPDPHGRGLYTWDGSQWTELPSGNGPSNFVSGSTVVKVPGTSRYLFSTHDFYSDNAYLFEEDNGAWTQLALPYDIAFTDIDLLDAHLGYGISGGVVFQYDANTPPNAAGSITPSSGTTTTTFSASGSGSSDPDGDSITHRWYWGDGTASSGSTASHRYDDVGSLTVTHRVTDELGAFDDQTITLDVDAQTMSLGGSKSGSFTSNRVYETHHYKIPAASGDRYIELELDGPWYLSHLKASLGSPVEDDGSWPTPNDFTTDYYQYEWDPTLAGKVPSGQALYVAVHNPRAYWVSDFDMSYTVSAKELLAPKTPTTGTVWSPQNGEYGVSFSAKAPHNDDRDTQLWVDWGDGSPLESYPSNVWIFTSPTKTHYLNHDYASPGTYTIRLKTVDDATQESSWVTRSVTVLWPPEGQATGATDVTAVSAELHGTLDDMGGDSSVDVRYEVYNDGSLVDSSSWMTRSSTGALPSYTASGLTSGTSYTYKLALNNDVSLQRTGASVFETVADLTSVPSITSSTATVNLGQSVSLSFESSQSNSNDVAYWIRWGDGTGEERLPASGWVPWDQVVTATHLYGFADTYDVEIRLQDESLARSGKTVASASILGDPPLASLDIESFLDNVELTVQVGEVALDPGTDVRFSYYDPAADAWTSSSWFPDVGDGDVRSWQTGTLDRSRTYEARVELRNDDGSQWIQDGPLPRFQTNRAPTLTAVDGPASVSPEGHVTFEVTYRDAEGDPPVDDLGDPKPPVLEVAGESYEMHAPTSGASSYKSGVTYTYTFLRASDLGEGLGHAPTYSARDVFQEAAEVSGASVFVNERSVLALDFEDEPVGSAPGSLSRSSGFRNYWHVVDTDASSMPDRVAVGRHGNALWFAHPTRGTYEDPNGGTPKGSLTTKSIDLGVVTDPVLSFSSYYETEDLGTSKDRKLVEIRERVGSSWSSWQTIHEVQGYEGGYGAWRSQHVDLSAYAGEVVQVRFRFDAVDSHFNRFLGWLVDDVVVGQDRDGDSLPDDLENLRTEVRVSKALSAAPIPDGGQTDSFVRRIDRPHADAIALRSLISHPDPQQLEVTVGVSPSAGVEAEWRMLVYDQGSVASGCQWHKDWYLQPSSGRPAVAEMSDGLEVAIDLRSCVASNVGGDVAKPFQGASDWFVEVRDTSEDELVGWIESVEIVTQGRTHPGYEDTDNDGRSDGDEVNSVLDPLGVDADADGIHEITDLDDNVPNWLPAFRLRTFEDNAGPEWDQRLAIVFEDNMSPITSVQFDAVADDGSSRVMSIQYGSGTTWSVNPSEETPLPDNIRVTWTDAYGTDGVIFLEMAITEGIYHPERFELRHTEDYYQRQLQHQSVVTPGHLPITIVGIGNAAGDAALASGAVRAVGLAVRAAGVVGLLVTLLELVPSAGGGGETVETESMGGPQGGALTVSNAELGTLLVGKAIVDAMAAEGITEVELKEMLEGIKESFKRDGVDRFFHRDGSLVVFFEAVGNEIHDAWKIQLPSVVDTSDGISIEDLLVLEALLAAALGQSVMDMFEDLPAHGEGRANQDCGEDASIGVVPEDATTGGRDLTVAPIPMDCISYEALVMSLRSAQTVGDFLGGQSANDFVMGNLTWGYMHGQALLGASQDVGNWFWDGGSSAVTCPTSGAPPDVRRCLDSSWQPQVDKVALDQFSVDLGHLKIEAEQDFLEFNYLGFKDDVGTQKFRDSAAAKGTFLEGVVFESLEEGKTFIEAMRDQMLWMTTSTVQANTEADVKIPYFLPDKVGGQTMVVLNDP